MERESFENTDIAKILNEHFVSIKVDREERPDVDSVYMTFVQATTGGGGWPMNVWLTPDLKPFVGGSYYPPDDREGLPGLRSMLLHITELWEKNREQVTMEAEQVMKTLQGYAARSSKSEPGELGRALLTQGFESVAASFDKTLRRVWPRAQISTASRLQFSFPRICPRGKDFESRPKCPGDEPVHTSKNGRGGNPRPPRGRLSPLFGGCLLARPPFREDAL